jgi:hypothetical protein
MNEETIVGRKGKGKLLQGLVQTHHPLGMERSADDSNENGVVEKGHALQYFREKDQILIVLDELIREFADGSVHTDNYKKEINDVRELSQSFSYFTRSWLYWRNIEKTHRYWIHMSQIFCDLY